MLYARKLKNIDTFSARFRKPLNNARCSSLNVNTRKHMEKAPGSFNIGSQNVVVSHDRLHVTRSMFTNHFEYFDRL